MTSSNEIYFGLLRPWQIFSKKRRRGKPRMRIFQVSGFIPRRRLRDRKRSQNFEPATPSSDISRNHEILRASIREEIYPAQKIKVLFLF
jgi:hypothetical protein